MVEFVLPPGVPGGRGNTDLLRKQRTKEADKERSV